MAIKWDEPKKEGGIKWGDTRASLAVSERLADAVSAEKRAKQASSFTGLATETAKETGATLADSALKFVGSAVKAPMDLAGQLFGGKPNVVADIPGIRGPQKSIQGTFASETIPQVMSGEKTPLEGTLQPVGETVLGAADVLGAKGLASGLKSTAKAMIKPAQKAITGIGQLMAKRAQEESVKKAIKTVTPRTKDLTPTEYENLLSRKRIQPKTGLKEPEYILSDREKAAAVKYKDILQDKDPVKNTISIRTRIAQEDADVGKFLEQNNGIFNSGELRNFITKEMDDVTDVMVPEERIVKLKDQITTNFLSSLKKNDMKSLWESRKEFDQAIEKAFSGSPTLIKEVKKKFRNAIQEYISENTPDGVYKAKMKDMTDLFNLEDILQTKAVKERGMTGLQAWAKEHPLEAAILGGGATAAGGGVLWNVVQ